VTARLRLVPTDRWTCLDRDRAVDCSTGKSRTPTCTESTDRIQLSANGSLAIQGELIPNSSNLNVPWISGQPAPWRPGCETVRM